MAQFTIFGYTFDHLASATPMANGATYRVITEDGYYIRKPEFEELEYKTATFLYPSDDLSTVEIVAFEDLPEGYVINGGGDNENNWHEITAEEYEQIQAGEQARMEAELQSM